MGLCESLLATMSVSLSTSSFAVAEVQREGERELPSDSSLSLCFFTKKTELGLKLKQGKTRKSSAGSSSPSFSQFPVFGGHFVS